MASIIAIGTVLSFVGCSGWSLESSTGLRLEIYNNTALAGPPAVTQTLDTFALSLPGTEVFSAEVSGTFSPPPGSPLRWSWSCTFRHVDLAFVTIDGHSVCRSNPSWRNVYNNSANGIMDDQGFRLLSKKRDLVVRMQLYHLSSSSSDVMADVRWCTSVGCESLPSNALRSTMPLPEVKRHDMQKRLAMGWGSWLHRDRLSVVLLPDSAVITVMLCDVVAGRCLREAQLDADPRGSRHHGTAASSRRVRAGHHAIDHSYSQLFVAGPEDSEYRVNVSIEYAVHGNGRDLDLVVTPQETSGVALDRFAVAFAGSYAWNRIGAITSTSSGLVFQGYGLEAVHLHCSAPALKGQILGVYPPGDLNGSVCNGDQDCASHSCSRSTTRNCGVCSAPDPLVHFAASLGSGPVGFTTRQGSVLVEIMSRVVANRHHHLGQDFGAGVEGEVKDALVGAIAWSHIFVPAENGPILPMTYGFTWITPSDNTWSAVLDWKYVMFCWDNIFASYIAGVVLGYKDVAYSNLIQIVKSKSNDGFVPNWAAGGSKNSVAEPAVGGRVLFELWEKFHDLWLIELLFDDLLDWNDWQWSNRRIVSAHPCCVEPGFITIGDDYQNCTGGNCPGGIESGLDQSPLWDCPGASANSTGGNCSVLSGAGRPWHLFQVADVQSTSLFVMDARALAKLAVLLPNRTSERARLVERASAMTRQLQKLWDSVRQSFANRFVSSGDFSPKLTPTAFYPLMAGAATEEQATVMVGHLTNRSEFCVSDAYATDNDELCYWGLPSVSRSDPSFMHPQSYIYWRGYTWGPMTMLVYWSLLEYRHIAAVAASISALAAQKAAQMLWMWRRHRHICENYSPYSPSSQVPPGDNKSNTDCTGWRFYNWGALNGVPALLEAVRGEAAASELLI